MPCGFFFYVYVTKHIPFECLPSFPLIVNLFFFPRIRITREGRISTQLDFDPISVPVPLSVGCFIAALEEPRASLVIQMVKSLPATRETQV